MSERDERWITVAVAAEATGRSEGWIYAAIRDHKLRVDHAKNAKGMRLQLVLRDEVMALSESSRGHLSDRALYVDRGASGDGSHASVGNDTAPRDDITSHDAHSQLDITSENRSKRSAQGWRDTARAAIGIAWQQGREVERLRAELDAERAARRALIGELGEERGRRIAAEQHAQAVAPEGAERRAAAAEQRAQDAPRPRSLAQWLLGRGQQRS